MNKKTFLVIAMVTAAVLFCPIKATSMTTVEKFHIDDTQYIDCYSEEIHITWDINIVNRVTFDANGRPHLGFHLNISKFSAVGLTTGTNYAGSQVFNYSANGDASTTGEPPWEFTFRIVTKGEGQGTAPNFIETFTLHVTVNAKGETTSSIDRYTFTCK